VQLQSQVDWINNDGAIYSLHTAMRV
jgi:hypothetical protein